jgi:hypothetical protein
MQAAQFGVILPEHIAESVRLYVEAQEYKNPQRFVSPQATGMPPNPQAYNEEKQQAQQQMQGMGQELQKLQQENAQLKVANANKQGEHQLKAMELMKPDAQPVPEDNTLEFAKLALDRDKLEIERFKAITDRMALGIEAQQAEAQFQLDAAVAQHDADMAVAAHEAEQLSQDQNHQMQMAQFAADNQPEES